MAGSILFVDDDPTLLDLLGRYLKRQGYAVHLAVSAGAALAAFTADSQAIALLVADLTLAEINGEELLAKMREKRPGLPGILLSGYPHEPRIDGVRFLQKPFMPQVLAAEIGKLLKP